MSGVLTLCPLLTRRSYVETVLSVMTEHVQGPLCISLLLSIDRAGTVCVLSGNTGCRVEPAHTHTRWCRREDAHDTVRLAAEYRSRGVCGIDLSGNPFVGDVPSLIPALLAARAAHLPTTLHFGEVLRPEEAACMLAFGPERVGHACYMDDATREALLRSKIPVEICPTSNVMTCSVPG